MALRIKRENRFALLKLGTNREVLYAEYKRAKRSGLTREELIETIAGILEEYNGKNNTFKAKKIMTTLLKIGLEGEENAETKKHR
jgi:hypothetical protein